MLDLHGPTVWTEQHHEAVSVGVAVEVPCDDMAVLSEDGHQPLVVVLANSRGVSGKRQVSNWHMCYDENLKRGFRWIQRILELCSGAIFWSYILE